MKKPNDAPDLRVLGLEDIRKEAESFRMLHCGEGLPVDIDLAVEKMGIRIVPLARMREVCKKDACVSPYGDIIWVTYDPHTDSFFDFRTRFSMAHEVAHLILHRPFFEWMRGRYDDNPLDWVREIRLQSEQYYASQLEREADEFAGRLLVPVICLREQFNAVLAEVGSTAQGLRRYNDDDVRNKIALRIHKRFEVSVQCLETRLRLEGVYPPLPDSSGEKG